MIGGSSKYSRKGSTILIRKEFSKEGWLEARKWYDDLETYFSNKVTNKSRL